MQTTSQQTLKSLNHDFWMQHSTPKPLNHVFWSQQQKQDYYSFRREISKDEMFRNMKVCDINKKCGELWRNLS